MKRRNLLQSLPAIALLPGADWLAAAQEKASSGQSNTRRLRIADLSRLRRQARRPAAPLSRTHHKTLREARNKKRGVLDAHRRTAQRQDSRVHAGASQPRSRHRQLEGFPRRSRMAKRARQIRSQRQAGGENRFSVSL